MSINYNVTNILQNLKYFKQKPVLFLKTILIMTINLNF